MTAQFRTDLLHEQCLLPFLDRRYAAYGIQVERCRDRDLQRAGIDARLSKGGLSFAVDEKAQLHYIGQCLPTFALEVDLLLDGKPRTGWLFDEHKETEVYAFVFDIQLKDHEKTLRSAEQVCGAEIILVNRQRLIAHLDNAGLTRSVIRLAAQELRRSNTKSRRLNEPGVRLLLSEQLVEQPVNLLVTRKFLRGIGQVLH